MEASADSSGQRPAVAAEERTAERPAVAPAERTAVASADRTAERPAVTSVERTAVGSTDPTAERAAVTPAERTAEQSLAGVSTRSGAVVTLETDQTKSAVIRARMDAMAGRGALLRLLKSFRFFHGWPEAELVALGPLLGVRKLSAGEPLIVNGSVDSNDYFLIDGALSLDAGGERVFSLSARQVDAGFPVAHLRPSRYTVVATVASHVLRIESAPLKRVQHGVASRFAVADRAIAGTWQEHPMWIELLRELERGTLAVPSLPAIAHRVTEQLAREEVNVARVAALIQTEPGLSAKLVKVANSAAMQRSNRCETVHEALTRLGLDSSRQLVVAFASERLFQQTDPRVRKHSVRIWQHSVDIAALAMVLARLTPPLQPDRALLAGLLHEIGALAILAMAQHHLDLVSDDKMLTDMITAAAPKVSAHVLRAWGFSIETVQAAQDADNWFRDGGPLPDYCDLLIVAHLHALVRQREFAQLPRIDETPAFGKLALGELTPKLSLLVLDEARVQVQEMRTLLG